MTTELCSIENFRKVPLVHDLNESELLQLTDIATLVEYEAGEVIVEQGGTSQNLWIIMEGTCEVVRDVSSENGGANRPVVLAKLEALSSFGEMSFFHLAAHSATVRAKTPVKIMRFDRASYDDLMLEGSLAAFKLMCNAVACLAQRLRRMDEWVSDILKEKTLQGKVEGEWGNFRSKILEQWSL